VKTHLANSQTNVTPCKNAAVRSHRFQFRFSIKALLIAMLAVGVLLGMRVARVRKQRQGVAWDLNQGGHISYDYEWPEADGSYSRDAKKTPGPTWLRNLIGIDYFADVTAVILDRDDINDLAPLTNLPLLRCVGLMNYVHPETDLAPLKSLTRLEELRLEHTGLDSAQVQPIKAALPNCRIESVTGSGSQQIMLGAG
jgi:hypothetical protein